MMEKTKMPHIRCEQGEVGKYVLLPGDPGRVEKIAAYLDNAHLVAANREFVTFTGKLNGESVSVTSTGIGGPSAAIAMEELVKLGAHTFIRVGTCGAIDASLNPGDLVLPTGAIRKDGTGNEYVPVEFPAVPNYEVLTALKQACDKLCLKSHMGIVECKDSYYGQHEPERMPIATVLKQKWETWKAAGAIASEMESSTLFLVSSILRVRCATVLLLCRNKEREIRDQTDCIRVTETAPAIQTAIEALKILIKSDKCKRVN